MPMLKYVFTEFALYSTYASLRQFALRLSLAVSHSQVYQKKRRLNPPIAGEPTRRQVDVCPLRYPVTGYNVITFGVMSGNSVAFCGYETMSSAGACIYLHKPRAR
ncbi:hypothetical protein EVAR_54978_1 [Eumeta japonica]|uniref:Uncharacterized protein n=1 Tax=Eumeta variegata TaxID=151549 RepID=A0A4C1Z4X1_EUMVA|nr:hypothetical protein EVAR_54978_1 [Eumeta japonica]